MSLSLRELKRASWQLRSRRPWTLELCRAVSDGGQVIARVEQLERNRYAWVAYLQPGVTVNGEKPDLVRAQAAARKALREQAEAESGDLTDLELAERIIRDVREVLCRAETVLDEARAEKTRPTLLGSQAERIVQRLQVAEGRERSARILLRQVLGDLPNQEDRTAVSEWLGDDEF